jgi:chorismate-pyruvate lyase
MQSSAFDSAGSGDVVDLDVLVSLFYGDRGDRLARFIPVEAGEMPAAYRRLLDHDSHMTIAVESFHDSPVNVRVERSELSQGHYVREIVLVAQKTGRVVQYGIVRLRPDLLQSDVWREIEAGDTPLGRVLISHNVFRQVERVALWKAIAGPSLAKLLQIGEGDETFGRTARIFCDGEPAIELLEIVAPVDESDAG